MDINGREWHTHASSGKVYRVRRSGKTQLWKTRPGEFKIPVKFGLYQSLYLTHENAHEWNDGSECSEGCEKKGGPKS
jgi:hypothetical protein